MYYSTTHLLDNGAFLKFSAESEVGCISLPLSLFCLAWSFVQLGMQLVPVMAAAPGHRTAMVLTNKTVKMQLPISRTS